MSKSFSKDLPNTDKELYQSLVSLIREILEDDVSEVILTLDTKFVDIGFDSIKYITEEDTSIEKYLTPQYEYFGKKLNFLLLWMTSRVQYMKDTFDSIKNYSEMIVELNNDFIKNIKNSVKMEFLL